MSMLINGTSKKAVTDAFRQLFGGNEVQIYPHFQREYVKVTTAPTFLQTGQVLFLGSGSSDEFSKAKIDFERVQSNQAFYGRIGMYYHIWSITDYSVTEKVVKYLIDTYYRHLSFDFNEYLESGVWHLEVNIQYTGLVKQLELWTQGITGTSSDDQIVGTEATLETEGYIGKLIY